MVHTENKMKKHYIIGDVHGEYTTLLALLEKIPKDSEIIFVGDLIDRGFRSREVVALVRKRGYQVVNVEQRDKGK